MKTPSPIASKTPATTDQEHRVLQFRPRGIARLPDRSAETRRGGSPDDVLHEANDLSRYEQDRPPPDDFRHRMLENTAAFALTVVLTAIGIWLVISLAQMRNTQDCVLMGRSDCARISATR